MERRLELVSGENMARKIALGLAWMGLCGCAGVPSPDDFAAAAAGMA